MSRLILLIVLIAFTSSTAIAQVDEWSNVQRIVAVGDIHGDYDNYITTLKRAGIINKRGNWAAGETHFVQVGDLPDRGPDTNKIIEHMMKLEKQARRKGGMVHALIGNHEMMNMVGDLRYVHPGEYEAFRNRKSKSLQNDYYKRFVEYQLNLQEQNPEMDQMVFDEAYRQQWNLQYPLGYVEHRMAWNPQGEFGKWVLGHNSLIKINNVLFLHAGIGPEMLGMSIRQLNETVKAELSATASLGASRVSESEDGPLWYRGFVQNNEEMELSHLESVLEFYGVEHIVVGHTPGMGTIVPRFEGRVLAIDTGISKYYGSHIASLQIENGQFFNIQKGEVIAIPSTGEDPLAYFQEVLILEPEVGPLRKTVEELSPQL